MQWGFVCLDHISGQHGLKRLTSNLPRLGLSLPASTLSAVDLPMPFVPTRPSTCPGLGTGNLYTAPPHKRHLT